MGGSGSEEQSRSIKVILTFDDGPHHARGSGNRTRRVLATLATNSIHNGINAVFFIESDTLDSNDRWMRGKSTEGKKICDGMIDDGHLVQAHAGFKHRNSHLYDHIQRLTQPAGDNFQDGLPGDLLRLKSLINGWSAGHCEFVRPIKGNHNRAVRDVYSRNDISLRMVMWDVDSKDSKINGTLENVEDALDTQIPQKLQAGLTTLVILFHDLDKHTYPHLADHIARIDSVIRGFVLAEEQGEDEQTQFVPDWSLDAGDIRAELRAKDWVADDDRH